MALQELHGHIVLDWDRVPLGTVRGFAVNARTSEPRAMRVRLSEGAREMLGAERDEVEIPMAFIAGIRRGEVTIDRPARELGWLPDFGGFPPA